jgi:hypothetical protein
VSLDRRLKKLEVARATGRPCPECGWSVGNDRPGDEPAEVEVTWVDDGSFKDPEFCETCGRQLVFIVTWGDTSKTSRLEEETT